MLGSLRKQVDLRRANTWGIAATADYYYQPTCLNDLANLLSRGHLPEPIHWLGLGSNVLLPDTGLRGTVIHTHKALRYIQNIDGLCQVDAGVPCAKLARYCTAQGFTSGSFFAGIPGTIGGALAMNAGAFGQETWNYVVDVLTIDPTGRIQKRPRRDFTISYRTRHNLTNERFLQATFQFQPDVYGPSIPELLKRRKLTQPIGQRSCGSVFKNPYPKHAAALIEGLNLKGYHIGDAEISAKHANFIINRGRARTRDIQALVAFIEEKVFEHYQIRLDREFVTLGE